LSAKLFNSRSGKTDLRIGKRFCFPEGTVDRELPVVRSGTDHTNYLEHVSKSLSEEDSKTVRFRILKVQLQECLRRKAVAF
jgi:hypothetical protein